MVFSTIDIGTNTILMVTLAIGPDGTIEVLGDEHAIARLGRGVDATRTILPETFNRLEQFLLRYRSISQSLGAERIMAFGTSALRDARNREQFIQAMYERTGIRIELLSGKEEAELTYRGALFGFPSDARRQAVIDIGGGSTEIAVGTRQQLEQSISIDIGAVRITERFLTKLPATSEQIEAARTYARDELQKGFELPPDAELIGVAGTVTTLGAIIARHPSFDAEELNGLRMNSTEIGEITRNLLRMPIEQIMDLNGVHPDRADILPGGALILDEFLRLRDIPIITVSTRGVRYGVALRENP